MCKRQSFHIRVRVPDIGIDHVGLIYALMLRVDTCSTLTNHWSFSAALSAPISLFLMQKHTQSHLHAYSIFNICIRSLNNKKQNSPTSSTCSPTSSFTFTLFFCFVTLFVLVSSVWTNCYISPVPVFLMDFNICNSVLPI